MIRTDDLSQTVKIMKYGGQLFAVGVSSDNEYHPLDVSSNLSIDGLQAYQIVEKDNNQYLVVPKQTVKKAFEMDNTSLVLRSKCDKGCSYQIVYKSPYNGSASCDGCSKTIPDGEKALHCS